ncbi:MAG: hypothetical protein OEY14_02130 [Myxococcales bacterium]|nr:hypothetical protein [Myxococcales bacterium]
MDALIPLLAALGGLLAGIGLGLMLGRLNDGARRRQMARLEVGVRTSVLPILEGRAAALGLPAGERAGSVEDPFRLVVELSSSIRRHERDTDLPFTDTVEVDSPLRTPSEGESS